jgi:hypothetical protein
MGTWDHDSKKRCAEPEVLGRFCWLVLGKPLTIFLLVSPLVEPQALKWIGGCLFFQQQNPSDHSKCYTQNES